MSSNLDSGLWKLEHNSDVTKGGMMKTTFWKLFNYFTFITKFPT